MNRSIDIALKDLLQLRRDRNVFMFLLIMPIVFTVLFGYAFGGIGGGQGDARLPVGFINLDSAKPGSPGDEGSWLSQSLHDLLSKSKVIRLVEYQPADQAEMESKIADEKLAGGIIVPAGYGRLRLHGKTVQLILIADKGATAGISVESEVLGAAIRMNSALQTALILERNAGDQIPFRYAYQEDIKAWEDPPIRVKNITSSAISQISPSQQTLAHFAPGMMLQFAIAGLLTSAQIMVEERKNRSLQRLLSTAVPRVSILFGHYLAIFLLIFLEILALVGFGQLVLGINYLGAPLATLAVAFSSALCIAALGLLIGVFARTDEQAVIFSIVPMFVLSGLGGAWVPLEVVGETFRLIGHFSPIAWGMDGFENITIRGLGLASVLLPCAALVGYMLLFLLLSAWRFARLEER